MDGSIPASWIPIISILILFRLLNNFLKAGFFGLGSISLFALAEKSRENDTKLFFFLDDPYKLGLSAQFFDKLSLILLALMGLKLVAQPNIFHLGGFFLYLWIFDLLLPNMISSRMPEASVTRVFPILRPVYWVFYPFTRLMMAVSKSVELPEEDESDEEDDPEDIRAFIRAGAEEGIIDESESSLLRNLLHFNDTIVREVMTPRTDMECLEIGQSKKEMFDVFKRTKFSRLPVYRNDIDHIEGILRFKDMIGIMDDDRPIDSCLMELLFVPEKRGLNDLLQDILTKRMQMAIVIDEYGGTSGLITLEDVVEELIGEIHDEHEIPGNDSIVDLQNGSYLVDGRVLLEDFCEIFSVDEEDEDVDTVGGFIFNKEGYIPKVGETVFIGSVRTEIAQADDRRIYKLTVTPSNPINLPKSLDSQMTA